MNFLPWLAWTWLLVLGVEGVYLVADFFFGPWFEPLRALTASPGDRLTPGDESPVSRDGSTLRLVIALVVANALFVAALRQFGEDKPAIIKFALFLAAAFVWIGALIALYEAKPVLAVMMLWTGWTGMVLIYSVLIVITMSFDLWRLFREQ